MSLHQNHYVSKEGRRKSRSHGKVSPNHRVQRSTRILPAQKSKPFRRRDLSNDVSSDSDVSDSTRSSSPGLVLDASSQTFKERSAQDDAEISALEKRLGLEKRRAKGSGDDMLDYLLGGLDGEQSDAQDLSASQDWLAKKRRKLKHGAQSVRDDELHGSADVDVDVEVNMDIQSETPASEDIPEGSSSTGSTNGTHDEEESSNFSGFSSHDEDIVAVKATRKPRENPYIPPVAAETKISKYVPPSLRSRSADDEQSTARLKRQIQGHLNKLSEANLISILSEIEGLYRSNPRQDVTSSVIDLLLSSFSNKSALQNTFIILHAAFVVAVYKTVGTDFGAEILVRLVERIDERYRELQDGKQTLNLVSLLANLFTFGLVSSNIIYDYVRLLLSDFNESNAELLLRIVRDCGPQLRSDDPSALKGIVQMVQNISADMAKKGQQLNVRTRVMVDTITDLKNSKMKNATNAAGVTGEHITRMRKTLGSLNNRSLKATEPLRITKHDIESSEKKGRWWLVGASWKEGSEAAVDMANASGVFPEQEISEPHEQDIDYLALAKQFRMNTDVRRSIFVAIMSADDVRDAQLRLLKLRLTSKQEQEIAKVLLRCTRAEPVYNPYYTLLAKNLCKDNKKIRIGFQFGLWAFFNTIGEKADDEDSDADGNGSEVMMSEIVNIAKMFAYLIYHNHLQLGILKTLNIGFLKEQANTFLEVLLISIMSQPTANDENLLKVFGRASDTPQIIKSLQYFIKQYVQKSDLISKSDRNKIKNGCKIADVAFNMMTNVDMGIA